MPTTIPYDPSLVLGNIVNKEKLKIPDDISIVGFDDLPWAKAISPPLTVVKQPAYEMGQKAAELFFKRVEEPSRENVEVVLEPKLIIRQSTAEPITVA